MIVRMTHAKEVEVVYHGLETVPGLFAEIRGGVAAARAFSSAPQAAMSSGSPVMAAAIVGLGIELALFVYQTVQAIDDDIDAMRATLDRYRDTDDRAAGDARLLETQVCGLTVPVAPAVSTGTAAGGRPDRSRGAAPLAAR